MIDLDKFMVRIMARVPGAPYPAVEDAIRVAAERFCERTKFWRSDDAIALSGELTDYPVAPNGSMIHEIAAASIDGRFLEHVSIDYLNRSMPDWKTKIGTLPMYITQTEVDTVQFVPIAPSGTVQLQLVLKPAPDCDQLPDFMYQHHSRVIADGALSELMMMPGQEFTNPDLASVHEMKFTRALDQLASQSIKGQQRGPVRTEANFF